MLYTLLFILFPVAGWIVNGVSYGRLTEGVSEAHRGWRIAAVISLLIPWAALVMRGVVRVYRDLLIEKRHRDPLLLEAYKEIERDLEGSERELDAFDRKLAGASPGEEQTSEQRESAEQPSEEVIRR